MKPWIYIAISIIVAIGIGVGGYFFVFNKRFGPSCPVCPHSEQWSICDENYKKTRTSYRCSKETNYKCESYIEEGVCETSIAAQGKKGLKITLSPTKDRYVSGEVTVSIDSVPQGSGRLIIIVSPKGVDLTDNPYSIPGVVVRYLEPVSGQGVTIDTRGIKEGDYSLFIGSSDPNGIDSNPWLDFVQIDLVIMPEREFLNTD